MNLIGPVPCNGRFGYINPSGKFIVPPDFEELGKYSEGLISFKSGKNIGFLNPDGSVKIPPSFEDPEAPMPVFKSGLAAVQLRGRFGFITIDGNFAIKPEWHYAWDFLNHYVLVESEPGYFVLDQKGQIINQIKAYNIPGWPDWIKDWNCFRAMFSGRGADFTYGCLNWRGEEVFAPIHSELTDFCQGVAGFYDGEQALDNRWGLLNFVGDILKPAQFLALENFSEGLAVAARTISSKWKIDAYGYIDLAGNWMINPRFHKAYPFSGGLARVAECVEVDVSGKTGKQVRYGFINQRGETIIPAIFSSAHDFVDGYAIVQNESSVQVIDQKGAVIYQGAP